MKIFSPVKDYTGVSASVPFCNGAGETDDPHLIEWFKDHGYIAEETDASDSRCKGLYPITVKQEDGSSILYFCDTPDLKDCRSCD